MSAHVLIFDTSVLCCLLKVPDDRFSVAAGLAGLIRDAANENSPWALIS